MKNELSNISYIPTIHYGSESIDITRFCCDFIVKNHFYTNNIFENIMVLEKALYTYSRRKIFDWYNRQHKPVNLDNIELLMNLEGVIEILNFNIPTEQEKYDFFMQYVHCIIYILGKINKQNTLTNDEEMILQEIINIEKTPTTITKVTPNSHLPIHEIPCKLIQKLKEMYVPKEKNSILIK